MHRLFVAIRPPQSVLDQLQDMMEEVPNARWQDEDQLHLTLRFIGEVERPQAEDIAAALGSIHHPRMDLCLSGVGIFERRGKGALWAGIAPHAPLKSLHKKIDQACLRAGIAPDTRAYHPHITLARTGRQTGPLGSFLERWAGLSSPAFPVENFRLYESRLGAQGASYTVVARYPLSGEPGPSVP